MNIHNILTDFIKFTISNKLYFDCLKLSSKLKLINKIFKKVNLCLYSFSLQNI